jgi:hypothetical protein
MAEYKSEQYARMQSMLEKPELALIKMSHRLYGIKPSQVVRSGKYLVLSDEPAIRFMGSPNILRIGIDEARKDIRRYFEKEKEVTEMGVSLTNAGITSFNLDPLYRSTVTLRQVIDAQNGLRAILGDLKLERAEGRMSDASKLRVDFSLKVGGDLFLNTKGIPGIETGSTLVGRRKERLF